MESDKKNRKNSNKRFNRDKQQNQQNQDTKTAIGLGKDTPEATERGTVEFLPRSTVKKPRQPEQPGPGAA